MKHSGLPAVELTDVEAANEFIAYKDEVVAVGFFESNTSDKAAAYLAADGVTFSLFTFSSCWQPLTVQLLYRVKPAGVWRV